MRLVDRPLRVRLAALGTRLIGKTYGGLLFLSRQMCGLENLPEGACILAPNHPNASDPFHMYAVIPDLLGLAHADLFKVPLLGWCFRHSGQIPVDDAHRAEAYERGRDALAQGRRLLVFPEGMLNPEGKILKVNSGPVRMALETGAPIVPCGIYVDARDTLLFRANARDRPPRAGRWQFRGRCFLEFGEPWFPAQERIGGELPDLSELTEMLMVRIRMAARQARGIGTQVDR